MELTVLAFVFFLQNHKAVLPPYSKGGELLLWSLQQEGRKAIVGMQTPEQVHKQNWLEKSMISVTSHNHSCAHMQLCDTPRHSLMTTFSSQGEEIKEVCDWCTCVYYTHMSICVPSSKGRGGPG